jgi:hypothetical protein
LPVELPGQVLADLNDLGREQVIVVEEPLAGRRDERAVVDVFGQGLVGLAQDARVVAQAPVDAAGAAALRVNGETGREGERPLLEPFRAEQLIAERLVDLSIVTNPGIGEQIPSGNPRTVPEAFPLHCW